LSQFSVQRKTTIRKYQAFVQEELKNNSVWSKLNNQIYLGDETFIKQVKQYMGDQDKDLQIPKIQKQSIAKSLVEYERMTTGRDEAIRMLVALTLIRNWVIALNCILLELERLSGNLELMAASETPKLASM
jgi:hypothetical protein